MDELITQLNLFAKELGYDKIQTDAYRVLDWGNTTSTTLLFNNKEECVRLNDIIGVPVRTVVCNKVNEVPSDYKGVVAIHRCAISYLLASRCNTSRKLGRVLQPVINAGVIDLINQVGFLGPGYRITMEQNGGGFFRELETHGGLEFRLTLYKE